VTGLKIDIVKYIYIYCMDGFVEVKTLVRNGEKTQRFRGELGGSVVNIKTKAGKVPALPVMVPVSDFRLDGDVLVYKTLWGKGKKDYSKVPVRYSQKELEVYRYVVSKALRKVWSGYSDILEFKVSVSGETVADRLVKVLLLHLGQRDFWYRFPFQVECEKQLVVVVRNYLIDIQRWLSRRSRVLSGVTVWTRIEKLPYYFY
jgi:hypothetical protein